MILMGYLMMPALSLQSPVITKETDLATDKDCVIDLLLIFPKSATKSIYRPVTGQR